MSKFLFFLTSCLFSFSVCAASDVEVSNEVCELKAQVEREMEAAAHTPRANSVFVALRFVCNTAGITYSYYELLDQPLPLKAALTVGLLGGFLSAVQQIFHKKLTQWQTHQGYFRIDKQKKASLFEAFIIKEYSLHVLYLGALHAVLANFGIKESYLSAQVFSTALLSLFCDGLLNVANYKMTDRNIDKITQDLQKISLTRDLNLEDFKKFKSKISRAWIWSKGAAVGISFTATVLAILDMEQIIWAAPSMYMLGLAGGIGTLYLFREQLKKQACSINLRRLSFRRFL